MNLNDDVFDLGVRFQGVHSHFFLHTHFACNRQARLITKGAGFVICQRRRVGSAQVT